MADLGKRSSLFNPGGSQIESSNPGAETGDAETESFGSNQDYGLTTEPPPNPTSNPAFQARSEQPWLAYNVEYPTGSSEGLNLDAGTGLPDGFPQPSVPPEQMTVKQANEYQAQIQQFIVDYVNPSSPIAREEMLGFVGISMPKNVPDGTRVGFSAPVTTVGNRGQGGYYESTADWVKALQNVENSQWYRDIMLGKVAQEANPDPAAVGAWTAGLWASSVTAQPPYYSGFNSFGSPDDDLQIKNPWSVAGNPTFQSMATGMYEGNVPVQTITTPSQIAQATIVGESGFNSADYLDLVRSRNYIETELQEMLGVDSVILPANSTQGHEQWAASFGSPDAVYAPELLALITVEDSEGVTVAVEPSTIDPSQFSGDPALQKTLEWYKNTESAQERERFVQAVVLAASWEEGIEKEASFLENQGYPLMENWARYSVDVSPELKEQIGRDLESPNVDPQSTARREAVASNLAEQLYGDIQTGQNIILDAGEMQALEAMHGALGIQKPLDQLNKEELKTLLQATVYTVNHFDVLAAEGLPADDPEREAKIQAAVEARDGTTFPYDLTTLGVQDSAAALQKAAASMNPEMQQEMVELGSLNFQVYYMDRMFSIMQAKGQEVAPFTSLIETEEVQQEVLNKADMT